MVIYHFKYDSRLLRQEILPAKKLFIMDMYDTLYCCNEVMSFPRPYSEYFLALWKQEKIICTDGWKSSVLRDLEEIGLPNTFREIYEEKHLDKSWLKNRPPKRYEAIAASLGYSRSESIVFEDWNPDDSELHNLDIDFVMIPHRNFFYKESNKYQEERKKLDNFSFKGLLPL